jgi:hypothetical protein
MEAYENQKGGGKKGEGSKGLDLSDYNYSAQLEQTQRQNPLASTAGNMGYQLGSYAAFAPLVEGIPVVGKAASALGGKFSNPAVAKAVESIVSGQAADTILDTLPNEIIPDLMEGNWRDLPKDIALNQLGNLAFNVAGEGIGALARNFIPSLRQADEVADAVKRNELDPADLARQNEMEVNPDDVIYHSGIVSRLNKSDSAGKMEGTRDTGYYGTGHYFVDNAHKNEIGPGTSYGNKPYTSVDISKYDNLFKADTDAKASALHDLSQRMMRYINGYNDSYFMEDGEIIPELLDDYMGDMYSNYSKLFGDRAMSREAFENWVDSARNNYRFDYNDRGDSAFTTFMKEHGYNGVDTRGTRSADTERGVVIYDLDEDSILQSNVTDEAVKNGLMNQRVRNGNPLFDAETDARIQKSIDSFEKQKQVEQEYHRIYDSSKLDSIESQLNSTNERIKTLEENAIPYHERILNDEAFLDSEVEDAFKLYEEVGLDDTVSRDEIAAQYRQNAIAELEKERAELSELQRQVEELNSAYDAERHVSYEAHQQAQRNIDAEQIPEAPAQPIEQGARNVEAIPTTPNDIANFEAQRQQLFDEIDDAMARGEDPSMYYGELSDLENDMYKAHPELFDPETSSYVGLPKESVSSAIPKVEAEAEPETPFSIEGTNLEWLKNDIDTLTMPKDVRADLKSKYSQYENIYRNLGKAESADEITNLLRQQEVLHEDIKKILQENAGYPAAQKGKYDDITRSFVDSLNGMRINVPDHVRSELPDAKINDLNKHFSFSEIGNNGKRNYLDFKLSQRGGVPVDTVFADIDNATGHALSSFMERQGLNPDVTENQILGLIEYADYLKSDYFKNTQTLIPYDTSKFRDLARETIDRGRSQLDRIQAQSIKAVDEVADAVPASTVTNNAPAMSDLPKTEGGNVPPNNNPPIDLTQNADGDVRERGMSQHIRAEDTPMKVEGVSDEVQADFVDNPDLYKHLKNADTQALADDIYNSGDQAVSINGKVYSGDVETKFRKLLGEKNPASLPLGHQLAKDYSAAGNHDMAAQIYRDMGQALTESGQFSQASVLAMMKNDPLTALQYAQRQLDAINQQGAKRFGDKWKDLSLTDDEIQAFNSIEPGNADAIKALYDKIGARLGKEYPTSFMEKLLEGRKVAMLFNVRTNVRNVGANIPTLGLRWASDRMAALGEGLAHIINPDFKRTQAITGSGIRGRRLATEIFNSPQVKAMIDGTAGKYEIPELKNSLMNDRQVFKGTFVSKWINKLTNGGIEKVNKRLFGKEGVESGLETIRNATYKMLDLGDSPFVRENFIERLGSYIHAQGIKDVSEVPDEAIQTAWEEAMKATYKDDSWAVDMLRGIKGGIEKVPGVGKPLSQAVIPFLQAPGNIAARMVDYSPINATKGVIDIISGAANKSERAVRQGIDEAAKGLTGSGLILLGMKLREAGILTGDYSEDKDQKNFEKQNGFIPWALHIGDKYFQYDWAQPFAEPLIVGSLLQEAISNSDQYDSDILNHFGIEGSTAGTAIGLAKEGARASVNSWFNASPLQGLAELMSGGYNGTDIAQNIFDAGVSDFAGAFVPSLVNATAKTMDTTQRQTYDPSSKFGTFLNQQQAKIPGLSDNLPAKYDAWGEEMKYADSQGEAFAQRFAIPGDYGTDSNDPIDIEINNLFNATQDAAVFPWTAANKVGDRKLNNREVSNYQRDMGQRNRELVEAFMNSDVYQEMDNDSKVEALNTIYNTSKLITERDLFGKEIKDNSTYKKYIELFDEGGAQAVIDYQTEKIERDNAFIEAGLDKAYTSQSADAAYESNELPMYADYRQWLVDNGKRDSLSLWESYKANNGQTETQTIPSVQEQSSTESQRDSNGRLIPVYTENANGDAMSVINSSGVKINSAEAAWAKASAALPGITPNQFIQTWSAIDADGNGRPKKSEFVDYFNSMGYDENQAADILNGYYPNNYNPLIYSNGKWRQ